MLDQFFVNQSEAFYTINIIPAIFINDLSLTVFFGIALAALLISLYLLKFKVKYIAENYNSFLLLIIVFFWFPLFAIFSYNNIHDVRENYDYIDRNLKDEHKKIIRYCNLGYAKGNGEYWCKLMTFVNFAMNNVKKGSSVYILSSDKYYPYLIYNIYPHFKLADSLSNSEYIFIYEDRDYYREGQFLKSHEAGNKEFKNAELVEYYSDTAAIFQNK